MSTELADKFSLMSVLARWTGKNVNFSCSLWQFHLSPSGIQADNLCGLIYFCVLYNLALEYTQNMEICRQLI